MRFSRKSSDLPWALVQSQKSSSDSKGDTLNKLLNPTKNLFLHLKMEITFDLCVCFKEQMERVI